jgi:hypothetical protein
MAGNETLEQQGTDLSNWVMVGLMLVALAVVDLVLGTF